MRRLQILVFLLLTCLGCAIARGDDPESVLDEARRLATQGNYEAALQKHVWFHENALKHDRSWVGVRLSFALADWVELGKKYPKAAETLIGVRDKNARSIAEGRGSYELFRDVAAINGYLNEETKTVELFKLMHHKYPDLAKRCYHLAAQDLAAKREYKLCSTYLTEPLKEFDTIREIRELHLRLAKGGPVPDTEKWFEDRWRRLMEKVAGERFEVETCRLIEILAAGGRKDEAAQIRDRALTIRNGPRFREAIEKALQAQEKPQ